MKPSIILLAPEPLLASWSMNLQPDPKRPLLPEGEVACVSSGLSVPDLLDGDGQNQLLVCLLGEGLGRTLAAVRERHPKLVFAVAENPQVRAEDARRLWGEELLALVDYRVVCDMSDRDGTSLYAAAKRFLKSLPRL